MLYAATMLILVVNGFLALHARRHRSLLIRRNLALILTGMMASFLCLSFCMAVYMAKDLYYSNVLTRIFFIPPSLWSQLIWLKISKDTLIRLMNLFSVLFTLLGVAIAIRADGRRNGWMVRAVPLFTAAVLLTVFDPMIKRLLYRWLYPRYLDYGAFQALYLIMTKSATVLRIAVHAALMVQMARRMFRQSGFREMRRSTNLMLIFGILMQGMFLVLFYWVPSALSQYHVYAGVMAYEKIPLTISYASMNLILLAQIGSLMLVTACMGYQLLFDTRLREEKRSLTRSLQDATFLSRTFSHYLKNEILAIAIEIDLSREEPQAELDLALDRVRARCDAVLTRLDELKFHNPNQVSMVRVQMQYVLKEVVEKMRMQTETVAFILHPAPRPVHLWIDPPLMSEALFTILHNAVDALTGLPTERRRVEIALYDYEQVAEIRITDYGAGIDEAELNHIFDPYYTNKPARTNWGLGLYLLKQTIAAHDGRVSVRSKPDQFTEFRIYLPSYKEES